MDMSFANQALATEYLARDGKQLEHNVYPVPTHFDHEIARLKLETMGIGINKLTRKQRDHLASWKLGT
jgi:adenosylhomocysteinase